MAGIAPPSRQTIAREGERRYVVEELAALVDSPSALAQALLFLASLAALGLYGIWVWEHRQRPPGNPEQADRVHTEEGGHGNASA
jgi:hypothetical protein